MKKSVVVPVVGAFLVASLTGLQPTDAAPRRPTRVAKRTRSKLYPRHVRLSSIKNKKGSVSAHHTLKADRTEIQSLSFSFPDDVLKPTGKWIATVGGITVQVEPQSDFVDVRLSYWTSAFPGWRSGDPLHGRKPVFDVLLFDSAGKEINRVHFTEVDIRCMDDHRPYSAIQRVNVSPDSIRDAKIDLWYYVTLCPRH